MGQVKSLTRKKHNAINFHGIKEGKELWIGQATKEKTDTKLAVDQVRGNCKAERVDRIDIAALNQNSEISIVDQPVDLCLDTLHSHSMRYVDRTYGMMLDRISSLF